MYFRVLYNESNGAATYLLADLDACEAVLIDARAADVPVLRALLAEHRLSLRWMLRTHEHAALLAVPEVSALAGLGAPATVQGGADAAVLAFGGEHIGTLATPGHTPGCVSYAWRDRLFCGDLLAMDACPYQPTPARPAALWDSVMTGVFNWPAETLLWAGHAPEGRLVSTVLEQRLRHPWFARKSRDEFLSQFESLPGADRHPSSGAKHHHEHHTH